MPRSLFSHLPPPSDRGKVFVSIFCIRHQQLLLVGAGEGGGGAVRLLLLLDLDLVLVEPSPALRCAFSLYFCPCLESNKRVRSESMSSFLSAWCHRRGGGTGRIREEKSSSHLLLLVGAQRGRGGGGERAVVRRRGRAKHPTSKTIQQKHTWGESAPAPEQRDGEEDGRAWGPDHQNQLSANSARLKPVMLMLMLMLLPLLLLFLLISCSSSSPSAASEAASVQPDVFLGATAGATIQNPEEESELLLGLRWRRKRR